MVNKTHKKQLELMYDDVCSVWEYVKTTNPKTKQTKTERTLIHENLPCRMSFGVYVRPAGDNEVTSNLTLSVVLFLSPDIEVKAGSEFVVERKVLTDEGEASKTYKLKGSSPPYIYPTHQEITCSILEDYA